MTPTPQQLAKARERFPCSLVEFRIFGVNAGKHCDEINWDDWGNYLGCPNCSLVPRVAALLAEVEAPLTDELDDLKRGLAEQGLTFDGNIVDAALHFVDSLKAENQRLAGELAQVRKGSPFDACEAQHQADNKVIEQLRARLTTATGELDSLSSLCAEVYQVVGMLSVESGRFDRDDEYGKTTVKVLDALSRAANREYEDIDHGLLPFNAQPESDCVEGLKARLNLKHSASPTDATQALCGAPPPFVWDNDSGVFCPACKKVETLSAELELLRRVETLARLTHGARPGGRMQCNIKYCAPCYWLKSLDTLRAVQPHPPDEGEEKP